MAPASVQAIWRVVSRIPRGHFVSYGEVARRAGMARRARLVGYALRKAPAELDLPWFRVTGANGRIAFPKGSTSHAEQLRRLRREGIRIERGRAVARPADLDALLWKP
ncbi:MAG TPA: MGMT family protein [Steroidobacteraceae bacterium]|nr:MGMT family protein [Steroidobacteraceae bacterium]